MLLEFKPTGNYFRVVPIQGITLKISEESKVSVIPSLSAKVHSGLSNVYDICIPVFFVFFYLSAKNLLYNTPTMHASQMADFKKT